jgi:hypothetical protein
MVSTPSGEVKKMQRKTKIAAFVVSVATAASPGIYSAWQSAKNAYQQRVEQKTRDTQETDLQKNVKGNTSAIDTLGKTCATHKDLLALAMQLQQVRATATSDHPRRRRSDRADLQRQRDELARKLAALKEAARKETAAKAKLKTIKRARPAMRKADAVRKMIQQKAE